MLIESDIFVALLKKGDWLGDVAARTIKLIESGSLGEASVSTEVFHELYYVFSDFAPVETILTNFIKIRGLKNIRFVAPTPEVYLLAVTLMKHYELTSVFDAIYAAQVLSEQCPDNTIISTDHIYDKIKGIKRIDPIDLVTNG